MHLSPGNQVYFFMQEDMKDFVTSKHAAGALFTMIFSDLADFSVASFRAKIERCADGGGDGGLTRATMRAASGLPVEDADLRPPRAAGGTGQRPGADVVETVGARQVRAPSERPREPQAVPRDSRQTLPGERLGLLLGAPRQQTAAARAAQSTAQRPRVNLQTAQSQGVVEGVAGEVQVQGAADPTHFPATRGARPFPVRGRRRSSFLFSVFSFFSSQFSVLNFLFLVFSFQFSVFSSQFSVFGF